VHEASWAEFVAHYGYIPHRLALLAGLKAAFGVLRAARCRRVYVDGTNFLRFFQRDRDTGQLKGIIAIDLGELP